MTPIERDDMDDELPVSPDLQLITDYLAKELPEEQMAEVRRRLDTDPAFKDFAAPLIAAWEIPPHWQRHPMSPETVRKHWDDFTRRAGFVHQKRKRRKRNWLIAGAILLALLATVGVAFLL